MPSRRVRVSICAVRTEDDVDACTDGGADAVGVLVAVRHRAEDAIDLRTARLLLDRVPPYVGRYAVTHLTEASSLLEVVQSLPIDYLQLGDEVSTDTFHALRSHHPNLRLIKTIHIYANQPTPLGDWPGIADALLFDSIDPGSNRVGGTGKTHNWSVTAGIVIGLQVPAVLAGGLTPGNVGEAVATVHPWAVNVNTGVETDGAKDVAKVRRLVAAANQLD